LAFITIAWRSALLLNCWQAMPALCTHIPFLKSGQVHRPDHANTISMLPWPADKSQQMSDWTARPLSQRQMHYAALDAYVLPQLYDRLCAELGEQRSQQLLKQHTTSVRRVSAAGGEQQQQQQQQQQDNPQKRHAELAIGDVGCPAGSTLGVGVAAAAAAAGDGSCHPPKRRELAAVQDMNAQ
jgi:hypothetical protein